MEEPARWVSKDVAARDLEMLRGAAGYIVRLEGLEREQRIAPSQFRQDRLLSRSVVSAAS